MSSNNRDKAGFGALLFSLLIPIVGIILYFSWKPTRPGAAKSALRNALISIGLYIVGGIACVVLTLTVLNTDENSVGQIDQVVNEVIDEDYE